MALSAGLYQTLASYRTKTRQLLRDENGSLYSDPDLTDFINQAIKQRDLDLGIARVRLRFTLTTGVFDYPFSTIIAGATILDGNTTDVLQDVRSIVVLPLGGASSSIRYPLGRWPYTKLSFLLSTSAPTYPCAYAMYGPTTVMVGPPPAAAYISEWDFVAYAADLKNETDQDPRPYPFSDPVPYQAARHAKLSAQRFDEADGLQGVYKEKIMRVIGRARAMSVQQPWNDLPRR